MQLPQQQVQPARQQLSAPSYQQQPHAALASTLDGAAPVEGPRDVLGRPVPVAAIAAPSKPAATPMSPAQMQQPLQVAAVSSVAGVPFLQLQQPLQQQQTVLPPNPQAAAACAGAVAVAAAAAAAGGDAGSQARHLTVLVHRLQSRPAEDVLAELAACAGVLCSQAWEDNFSKVCGLTSGTELARLRCSWCSWSDIGAQTRSQCFVSRSADGWAACTLRSAPGRVLQHSSLFW
jgi:hypothetical protein